MKSKEFHFTVCMHKSIPQPISNEIVSRLYCQFPFLFFEDPTKKKSNTYKNNAMDISENMFLKDLIESKFVTYQIQYLLNDDIPCLSKPTNGLKLVDAVICSNYKCFIFKQVDCSLISNIINKLKKEKIFLIDANVNNNMSNEQEEISNFCLFFKDEIQKNHFVKSTIAPISAFIIRRYFCPTYIFSNKLINCYDNIRQKKIKSYNRLNLLLNSYKEKIDILLESRLQLLIDAINENNNDINKDKIQIKDFKEDDFIILRTIHQNDDFFFYLVIHIESFYIFLLKKSCTNKYSPKMDHEIDFCKNNSHRCITRFYGFLKKENEIIGFIYEFMCNGTLENFILSNDEISEMYLLLTISRIEKGIEYLHSNSFIHRDLKPDNILIDNNFLPYVSDFNFVKNIKESDGNTEMSNDFGSEFYSSPEQKDKDSISYSTDIYSFGLIIYFLFAKKHLGSDEVSESIKNIPYSLKNLYKKFVNCIIKSKDKRPNIKEIQIIINEEIKSFYLIKSKFVNEIKFSDILFFFYERILSLQSAQKEIDSLFNDIFNFYFKTISEEEIKNPIFLETIGSLYYYGKFVNQNYLKSKKFLELAFKQDKRYGSLLLGNIYFQGIGVSKSYLRAKEFFEISAQYNESSALDNLGLIYEYGYGVERDLLKAENYFRSSANLYCDIAYIHLGLLYENVKKDYNKAKENYIKSTERGLICGYVNLGKLYENGLGVQKSYEQAKYFYEIAAQNNNRDALYQLGNLYQNGYGVKKNINKAIKYNLASAKKNSSIAYITLGNIYLKGIDVIKDYGQAKYYFEEAFKLNSSFAAYNLGYIYEMGLGINKDLSKALKFYEISANQNNSVALELLGNFYENGYIVEKNYTKALQYYLQSAKLNNSFAFVGIGNLYKYGYGVKQDIFKMFSFYLMAAKLNNPKALFYLGDFYSSGEFYEPEIDMSINYFSKCSKIIDFNNLFLESNEEYSYEFYGALCNYYLRPSFNNLGLIYIIDLNDIEKGFEYIKEAGLNEYQFGQNNLGLIYQFYYNEIENAKHLFKKASKNHFSLSDYNLGYLYEKEGKIEKAIEYYIKASDDVDEPLMVHYIKIADKRLEISKKFIDCLTNLKLFNFYFTQNDFENSKKYFIKCFTKLTTNPQNSNYQFQFYFHSNEVNWKNDFEYIKTFILNYPPFHLNNNYNQELGKTIDNSHKQNHMKVILKDDEFNDNISDEKIKIKMNNTNNKEKFNDKKKIDYIIFDNIDTFIKFVIKRKELHLIFIDKIKSIIDTMIKILYKKPYNILFGRIRLKHQKTSKKNELEMNNRQNINESFYEGFGL